MRMTPLTVIWSEWLAHNYLFFVEGLVPPFQVAAQVMVSMKLYRVTLKIKHACIIAHPLIDHECEWFTLMVHIKVMNHLLVLALSSMSQILASYPSKLGWGWHQLC